MKTAEGLVIEVTGTTAKVKVGRHNDCKNCGACPGDNSVVVCAKNDIGAAVGQRVMFEVRETNAVFAAFLVFIVPLLGIFVGAVGGYLISRYVGGYKTLLEIAGAAAVFIIIIICIKVFDTHLNKNERNRPSIMKII